MGAVKKAIKLSAALALVGLTIYGLSRLMKGKAETGWADIGNAQAEEPREPGDYRSIYNL